MSERIAILVIHGIGQQQPYETLDQFTRNLWLSLNASQRAHSAKPDFIGDVPNEWRIEPQLDRPPDPTGLDPSWTRVSFRLLPPPGPATYLTSDPTVAIEDITLFEYFWAPITQGRITYTGSLTFLIQAGLRPFLYLASNLNAIGSVQERAKRFVPILAKEIFRQACFFLPLLLFLAALLAWLNALTVESLLKQVHIDTHLLVPALALAVRILYLWSTLLALRASRRKLPGRWEHHPLWQAALAVGLLAHLLLWPFFFSLFYPAFSWHHPSLAFWHHASVPVAAQIFAVLNPALLQYWRVFVVGILAFFVRQILINYVGDVAVYVNDSQLSSTYTARTQILDQCSAVLADLLSQKNVAGPKTGQPVYDRVLIAAHSLGTVIAYDTMNALFNLARTADPDPSKPPTFQPKDLDNLRGLLTFGSPLNKIFYFFREQDDPKFALRRQSLNLLRGFRLKRTLTHPVPAPPFLPNPDPRWAYARNALSQGFKWINAYALLDPISGRIAFYDVDAQILCNYKKPGLAHLEYWEDPKLYTFFRDYLL